MFNKLILGEKLEYVIAVKLVKSEIVDKCIYKRVNKYDNANSEYEEQGNKLIVLTFNVLFNITCITQKQVETESAKRPNKR